MSRPTQHSITCRGCGWQQDFTTWESLNVTLDPDRKQELIEGTLTRFVCEKCTWSTEVVYPLLYHDMTGRFMVWLVPDGSDVETGAMPLHGKMPGYRLRWVRDRNELIEKVLIFDRELDDRLVEVFKALVRMRLAEEQPGEAGQVLFLDVAEDENGPRAMQFEYLTAEGPRGFSVDWETFAEMSREAGPKLPPVEAESGQWLKVDAAYAFDLLNGAAPPE